MRHSYLIPRAPIRTSLRRRHRRRACSLGGCCVPPLPDLRAQPPPLLLCPPPEPLPPGHPAGHLRGIGAIRLHGRRRLYNYTTNRSRLTDCTTHLPVTKHRPHSSQTPLAAASLCPKPSLPPTGVNLTHGAAECIVRLSRPDRRPPPCRRACHSSQCRSRHPRVGGWRRRRR